MANIRPEMLLPGFEIYSKTDTGQYIQYTPCMPHGAAVKHAIDSALVPLGQKNIYVKLPSHRVFVQQSFTMLDDYNRPKHKGRVRRVKSIDFNEITGMVQLPSSTSPEYIKQLYMSTGSILELDLASLRYTDKYRYDNDINKKVIPPGGYLLVAQLMYVRAAELVSVVYMESSDPATRIDPVLRKTGHLRENQALLEQAYQDIQRKRMESKTLSYPGSQVLRVASMLTFTNRHLVDARNYNYKHETAKRRATSNSRA